MAHLYVHASALRASPEGGRYTILVMIYVILELHLLFQYPLQLPGRFVPTF